MTLLSVFMRLSTACKIMFTAEIMHIFDNLYKQQCLLLLKFIPKIETINIFELAWTHAKCLNQ